MLDLFAKKWTCPVCGAKNPDKERFCPHDGTERKEYRESYDAFISYRRDYGSEAASVIQMILEKLGKYAFLDVTELQVGRFDEKLLERIEKDGSFILVLSPGALDRCVNKNDWLKREVMHAIRHHKNIIPVILPQFKFPDEATFALMPEEMRNIPNYQAVEYSHTDRYAMGRKIALFISSRNMKTKIALPEKDRIVEDEDRMKSPGSENARKQTPSKVTEGSDDKVVVRPAVAAGRNYPDNAKDLRAEIERYLAATKGMALPANPRMLISSHSPYIFSGPVAAYGYASLNKSLTTVIVIGPSHHVFITGVSISSADYYATPLGNVALNKELIAKLRKNSIVVDDPKADLPEHSIEVLLPFLQVVLPSFTIVPVIMGNVDPEVLANLLLPLIDDETLVLASSDLSHYHPNEDAKAIDAKTIATIMSGDLQGGISADGIEPIRTVMILAKKLGLSPVELNYRNSFETAPSYCNAERVVGYLSIAYVKNP
jgi:hypothetical protein